MVKCSFCSADIEVGTGKMMVKNDGRIFYYCSKKCERSAAMGRVPAKMGWIRKVKKKKTGKK